MAYCTQAELLKRISAEALARLASNETVHTAADAAGALGTAEVQARIAQALNDAYAEMCLLTNGHVDSSDSDISDGLEWCNAFLALYNLEQSVGKSDDNNPYRDKRTQILEHLKGINQRTLHVTEDAPAVQTVSNTATATRVFGRRDTDSSPMEHF